MKINTNKSDALLPANMHGNSRHTMPTMIKVAMDDRNGVSVHHRGLIIAAA